MATEYDLVILGGGTGGYVSAIRASQLGLKTAIVEKHKLGGTCLHKGCIPTKALLRSAEVYASSKTSNEFGIEVADVRLNFEKVQQRKQSIVQQLHNGVQQLMKKGKIDLYEGVGRILGPSIFSPLPGTISVEMNNGQDNEMLLPKNVIIATGSRPRSLPGLTVDHDFILTSDEALDLTTLPKSIIIVGGGVIGVEWASMLADFDVQVTLIEYDDYILPTEDQEISKEMERLLKKKGVTIETSTKVLPETIKIDNNVSVDAACKNEMKTFTAEKILVSVGRQANIEGFGLDNTDIIVENGFIKTNEFYQTKETHIYAIGDVIGGLQLAHVASHEGIIAVNHIANKHTYPLNPLLVPKCVYSSPEVASIGYTEMDARNKGYKTKIGKFPFKAIGKALINGVPEGFVKVVVDEDTDDLLGVHMIGPNVTEMIGEASLARVLDATPWELSHTIHPHPSLTEAIGEAALGVYGKAIHF
ncbi:dihydrolipoyl dehydrogenase [Metabacillus malikii]|uniref:Dihydrolipoyl dehydrogenase n=1 Tax=Metabacillus malikii TaxID=1504265 RepID=A0ABT9ZI06_9BACI|nr:dihydrolipoyl dehydrogenase [Metabacillus malikii]MDQ0231902.1 dihydrolipoamide dehydrogenase [Metabacillus malikii]